MRDDLTGATTVLYARRSKPDPANPGKSIDDQIDAQRARARRLGLNVVAEFTDDGIGASRHSTKTRPGFAAAVDYLRDNSAQVFSTWELSRATRRLRVFSDLMELCEERQMLLLVGDRIFDPIDPTDQMVLGMTAVQDTAEVARLRERVLRGVASTAVQGRPHGRNIYGYERIYDPRTRALLEVRSHPVQGPVIREMVTRTLAGESAFAIANDFNERGVAKPTGARWERSDIGEMLKRPTYRGVRDHKGKQVESIWPPLISEQEWAGLMRVFAGRTRGVHDTAAKHLLTGVAWCARCIKPMYVDTHRQRYVQTYYHCHGCNRSRNRTHLEAHVVKHVNALLANPRSRRGLAGVTAPAMEALRTQLDGWQAELDDAYSSGLSARGLLSVEQRLLPLIDDARKQLVLLGERSDLDGLSSLPTDDVAKCRQLLRGLVRVWVGPSRRGRGYDPASVQIRLVWQGPPGDEQQIRV